MRQVFVAYPYPLYVTPFVTDVTWQLSKVTDDVRAAAGGGGRGRRGGGGARMTDVTWQRSKVSDDVHAAAAAILLSRAYARVKWRRAFSFFYLSLACVRTRKITQSFLFFSIFPNLT